VRRGDDPAEVRRFTFAGMVTTDEFMNVSPRVSPRRYAPSSKRKGAARRSQTPSK
jgi:hypothetical protein